MQLEKKLSRQLIQCGMTLAVAESCTGGQVCDRLTKIPGASHFLWLGVIAYDYAAKTKILKIPTALLKKHGAVSSQVASRMALNVRKILNTDFGIGITGIAGPEGGTPTKPVGLVYIALSENSNIIVNKCVFPGNRLAIKRQAADAALKMLLIQLKRNYSTN